MNSYRYLLFDLDGTLIDSKPGIMNCFRYTAEVMGVPMPDSPECLLGPPLDLSFMKYFGLDKARAETAVRTYRERYGREGLFENSVYEGVPEMLSRLRASGFRLGVATCKAQVFAVRILERFGLAQYFDCIGGAGTDGSRTSKSEVIGYVLEKMGDPDKSLVLMIGDRDNDAAGAREAGIKCMGVLWGYGSQEELSQAGADFIAEAPQTLADILIGKE
jgi:phosphoglycolate phosphatase